MVIAYIGLGSNLGDRYNEIMTAVKTLSTLPDSILNARSSLYRTHPVGPQDQPGYLNAVVELDTTLPALTLLNRLQEIECQHGRVRGKRWAARTLDLDLLLYGEITCHGSRLTLPHPEMYRRGFVLVPLHEIAPRCMIPGRGKVTDLLAIIDPHDVIVLSDVKAKAMP